MRLAFYVLCLAMCSGIAGAQELPSNFEACIGEARQRHADSAMENYLSFKCDGAAAQRLAARPDQCFGDVKPSLRNVERTSRQLNDGLYLRIVWRTDVCAGMCETRFYTDARETNYLCEVRRRLEARIPLNGGRPLRNAGYDRRYADDDPLASPPPQWTYVPERPAYVSERPAYVPERPAYVSERPTIRIYEAPRYYIVRPRPAERWYSFQPGRYQEYRYPADFTDDDSRNDYRLDDYRRDDYRRDDSRRDDYRRDDYLRRVERSDGDRRDGYRLYEYR